MPEIKCPAGMNPNDPRALEQMRALAGLIPEEPETPVITKEDLQAENPLGLRPMSAGILAILERIDSPLFRQNEKREPTMIELLTLVWLLSPEVSEDELVEIAFSGKNEIEKAVMKWSLTLSFEEMQSMQKRAEALMTSTANSINLYSPGTDGAAKKK